MQNVKKQQRVRGKYWCFTLNNYNHDDISQFEDIKEFATYFVYGKEVGDSGNEHLQCFIALKKITEFATIKRYWPRAHFELMAAKDPKDAANYCKKGEQSHFEYKELGTDGPNFGKNCDYTEYGELPAKQGDKGGQATQAMWTEVMHNVANNQFEKIPPKILISHYGNLKKLYYDIRPHPKDLDYVCGIWIYGPPGVGKSHRARTEYGSYYDKMFNKWWDDYQDEETVLLDDFDEEHKIFGHHLKRWADKYTFKAEVKNHIQTIRPKRIVVTSNYHPNEIFQGKMLDAIERRFNIIHMLELKDFDDTISKKRKITNAPKKTLANIEKKPRLYRQDADGKIVPTNGKELLVQKLLDDKPHTTFTPISLRKTSIINKDPPEIGDIAKMECLVQQAEIMDSSSDTVPYNEEEEEDSSQTSEGDCTQSITEDEDSEDSEEEGEE